MRYLISLGFGIAILLMVTLCRGYSNEIPPIPPDRLRSLCQECTLILQGRVIELGIPPHHSSGLVPAFQEASFFVEKVMKGKYKKSTIHVTFFIFCGGWQFENPPPYGLSRKSFQKGTRHLLFLKHEKSLMPQENWLCHEVRPFNDQLSKQINRIMIEIEKTKETTVQE